MAGFFKKRSDETPSGSSNPKQKQQVLLLLLLLLAGAFAYLYYFTGLIKPREQAPTPPPVQNEQIKQAIPPRESQPPAPPQAEGTKAAAAPAKEKVANVPSSATPVAPPAQVATKQGAQAPQGKPNSPAVQQPAKTDAKPPAKTEAAKSEPAKPSAKSKDAKAPAANEKLQPSGTSATEAKPVAKGIKKEQEAKTVAAEVQPQKAGKPSKKQQKYALLIRGVPSSEEAVSLKNELTKAGLATVKVNNAQRPEPMNRLFVNEFPERGLAEIELQKVKKLNADAFILKTGSTFGVYAGSYFSEKRAANEKAHLQAKGVKVDLRKAKVTIPVIEVTAGPFDQKVAAEREAAKWGKKGFSVNVVKAGK